MAAPMDNPLNAPLYRSRILTSLFGARIALDSDNMLIGPPSLKSGVSTLGSTASAIASHGMTILSAAAASTYLLDAPIAGVFKKFFQLGSGSSHNLITGTSNIKIISTLGSSQQRVCLQSTGDFVELYGLSTASWAVTDLNAGVSITT